MMNVKDRMRLATFADKLRQDKTYAEHIGVYVINTKESLTRKIGASNTEMVKEVAYEARI